MTDRFYPVGMEVPMECQECSTTTDFCEDASQIESFKTLGSIFCGQTKLNRPGSEKSWLTASSFLKMMVARNNHRDV